MATEEQLKALMHRFGPRNTQKVIVDTGGRVNKVYGRSSAMVAQSSGSQYGPGPVPVLGAGDVRLADGRLVSARMADLTAAPNGSMLVAQTGVEIVGGTSATISQDPDEVLDALTKFGCVESDLVVLLGLSVDVVITEPLTVASLGELRRAAVQGGAVSAMLGGQQLQPSGMTADMIASNPALQPLWIPGSSHVSGCAPMIRLGNITKSVNNSKNLAFSVDTGLNWAGVGATVKGFLSLRSHWGLVVGVG